MYAAAHTAIALAGKRAVPAAPLFGLMVAAQASELVWVALNYLGLEHSAVDDRGHLHLEYLPYSHSVVVSLGLGAVIWGLVRLVTRRADVAFVFGLVTVSHIVLDIIQHEPNIRIVPWLAQPVLGMNLGNSPLLDFAVETALSVACWAYYRGSRKLLVVLLLLNVLNLPLMIAGEGFSAPLHNPFILPTVIMATILLAWGLVWATARRSRPAPLMVRPATSATKTVA
jgi:hypothetical protein